VKSFVLIALACLATPAFAQRPTPTAAPAPSARVSRTPRSTSSGSSLADAVKQSQKSQPQVKKNRSLGVITNENLRKTQKGNKPVSSVTGAVSVPQSPGDTAVVVPRDANGLTELDWKKRADTLRRERNDLEEKVRRLESETKRLENDFYAWSDGNYRDRVIRPSWEQAKEDLAKARANLAEAENAVANLEDEARKAGAPPGWLR
jgi:hypothetical protein